LADREVLAVEGSQFNGRSADKYINYLTDTFTPDAVV
jgi:hypothetical protein